MPTTLIIVAAVAILIILLATASYKVCPADRVMGITGPVDDASFPAEARSSYRSSCAWTGSPSERCSRS
mgnify:FL=1